MIGLALLGFWIACAAINWRHALRYFNDNMPPDEWASVVFNIIFATWFALFGGPFWLGARIFMATAGQRVNPVVFAKRLEGAPEQERLEIRLRQLETRNADLERQLGL